MNTTHTYKFTINDITFKGDIEINDAGLVAFKETSNEKMSEKYRNAIRRVLDELSVLPTSASELTQFKLDIE